MCISLDLHIMLLFLTAVGYVYIWYSPFNLYNYLRQDFITGYVLFGAFCPVCLSVRFPVSNFRRKLLIRYLT